MICSVVHTCTCLTGRNPWLPCAGVPKFLIGQRMRFLLFPARKVSSSSSGISIISCGDKIPSGQLRTWHHRDCQRLVITFKELKFTELQIKIRNHISLLPGDALRKVHTVPCKAFQAMNCPPRHGSSFFVRPTLPKSAMRYASVGSVFSIPI